MNLQRIMVEKGLNQVELAKRSGISQGLISSYILGGKAAKFPSLKNLMALAVALHCTIEELTGIETSTPRRDPDPEAMKLAAAILALPEDSATRRAIETLLEQYITGESETGQK